MAITDPDLWSRIRGYTLPHRNEKDNAAEPKRRCRTFVHNVRKDGDWTDESAERLVEEDGRFFYLMARSGTRMTPPTVIDKVWHIHLAMGDDFESRFCKEFGVKMTHETRMARGDALALYARGYEAYADEFCDQPPKYIWPSPWKQRNERFLTTIFHIGIGTFAAGCAIGIFFRPGDRFLQALKRGCGWICEPKRRIPL